MEEVQQDVAQATEPSGGVETSSDSGSEGTQVDETVESSQAELSPKAENRFQKLANENAKYKAELQEYQTKSQTYKDAIALHEWLTANPDNIKAMIEFMDGRNKPVGAEQKDPYSEYAPEVAEKFRKMDQFEKYIAQQEQERVQSQQRSIQENRSHLENVFERTLQEKGFISKDGSFDEFEVGIIGKAVLAELMELAQDKDRPTETELNQSVEKVFKGMSALEKRALKKTITSSGVPPTGSRAGSAPKSGGKETDAQRIARITAELGV